MTVQVLDFYADWCGPCKQQKPILEDLEEAYEDADVEFSYVDIEEDMEAVNRFSVQAVPTLVILDEDGERHAQMTGVQQKDTLERHLDELL